jgi:hypothetical protein
MKKIDLLVQMMSEVTGASPDDARVVALRIFRESNNRSIYEDVSESEAQTLIKGIREELPLIRADALVQYSLRR